MPATSPTISNFDVVFGARRGRANTLTPQTFANILSGEGVDEALREFGPDRSALKHEPLMTAALCDHVFARTYESRNAALRGWLRAVGVRPHWSLNILVAVSTGAGLGRVHIFPRGHELADSGDILDAPEIGVDSRLISACGEQHKAAILFNRGEWPSHLQPINPAASPVCSACAAFAADYPETQARDADDALPAPLLDAARVRWRAAHERTVLNAFVCGADDTAVSLLLSTSELDEVAIDFAARVLRRYPRPNILRALRSNGDKTVDWTQFTDDFLLAFKFSEYAWKSLLAPSLRSHISKDSSSHAWVNSLNAALLAAKHGRKSTSQPQLATTSSPR